MEYNLHTHTYRCRHASGADREYVEAAIEAGCAVLGFSDHCPQFFPTDYYSHFRMFPEQLEDYVRCVSDLKREYASDITILLGLETEYYPEIFGRLTDFLRPYDLDYMILGQHFIGNEYDAGSFFSGSHGDDDKERLRLYAEQVIEGLETGLFTYLAHPDISECSDDVYYREQMTRLCKRARELGIPLEYNILGYVNGRSYPSERFWRIAAEVGNSAVLGADAHSPSALLNAGAYEHCLNKLRSFGISPLSFDELKIIKPDFGSALDG